MLASIRSSRAALAGALLLAAACGDAPIAPDARAERHAGVAAGAHEIRLAAPAAESADAAPRAHEDAVLLAVSGAAVDSVTAAEGVHAAVIADAGGATHVLLTGRFPRGAAGRVATVWTRAGATPTIAVEQAVGGASLRQQPTAAYAAALR